MASDLKINVDGTWLNIRAGLIMKFENKIVIELSRLGYDPIIPGGRIRIGEKGVDTLMREICEEMGFELREEKISFLNFYENFFTFLGDPYHEYNFVYYYPLDREEFDRVSKIKDNYDNEATYFKTVDISELADYKIKPSQIIELVKEKCNE